MVAPPAALYTRPRAGADTAHRAPRTTEGSDNRQRAGAGQAAAKQYTATETHNRRHAHTHTHIASDQHPAHTRPGTREHPHIATHQPAPPAAHRNSVQRVQTTVPINQLSSYQSAHINRIERKLKRKQTPRFVVQCHQPPAQSRMRYLEPVATSSLRVRAVRARRERSGGHP